MAWAELLAALEPLAGKTIGAVLVEPDAELPEPLNNRVDAKGLLLQFTDGTSVVLGPDPTEGNYGYIAGATWDADLPGKYAAHLVVAPVVANTPEPTACTCVGEPGEDPRCTVHGSEGRRTT